MDQMKQSLQTFTFQVLYGFWPIEGSMSMMTRITKFHFVAELETP